MQRHDVGGRKSAAYTIRVLPALQTGQRAGLGRGCSLLAFDRQKHLHPLQEFPDVSLAVLSFKRPIVLSIDQLAALECGLASGPLFADKQTFTLSKLTSALCQ
jgi:hypothetical protein